MGSSVAPLSPEPALELPDSGLLTLNRKNSLLFKPFLAQRSAPCSPHHPDSDADIGREEWKETGLPQRVEGSQDSGGRTVP